MRRNEFFSALGISAATVLFAPYLVSCSQNNGVLGVSSNDFTLDLTLPANTALKSNGGSLLKDGVIVARTSAGAYIALSATCTHQGGTIQFFGSANEFQCPNHGAIFSASGSVLQGPASTSLQKFNTTLTGNSLRVYA